MIFVHIGCIKYPIHDEVYQHTRRKRRRLIFGQPDQTGVVGISGRKAENLIRKRIPDSSGFLGLCFKSWALVWGVGKNPFDFPAFILGTDAQASW